jgi:Domain of unknown function (DUF3883)
MSATAVREGDLVGISALLFTLRVHPTLTRTELLTTCTGYGLRGGAVPWESAYKIATEMRLVVVANGRVALTDTGAAMGSLVAADMEPSDEFARAVLTFAIGRSGARFTLAHAALAGQTIQDPRGTASPLLEDLVDVGLVVPTPTGDWELQDSAFGPLLVGLLFGAPKGTPIMTEVGRLGEKLTLRFYREQGWDPVHVSPISDAYGFDILCRRAGAGPADSLAVEAKATTATAGPYRFFASRHELRVARYLGARYQIALWGELDMAASLEDNYDRLRARGFPRIVADPYGHIETHAPGLLTGRTIASGSAAADGLVWHHT